MARDNLTHSEKYIKKTNRIILTIGITSLIIFIFGVILLIKSNRSVDDYEEPVITDNADVLNTAAVDRERCGERGDRSGFIDDIAEDPICLLDAAE